MLKLTLALGFVVAVFVDESSCQRIILPTFRPPVRRHGPQLILPTFRPPFRTQIRLAREADEPLPSEEPTYELHTELPTVGWNNRRQVRSLDSPSAKRGGGGPRTSSGSRNTGPTHPGYNRRNAREIRLPGHLNSLQPKPLFPRPSFPPVPRIPILARTARDIQFPGVKKPSYRDVIIPNWNPHVKTNPWDRLGGRRPRSISLEDLTVDLDTDLESTSHDRVARDVHISGLPELRKPTYSDVVIPNWNPNVKTDPWDQLGGRRGRSIDYDLIEETEDEFGSVPHERETREVRIASLPEFKKPSHRDVVIPNWNPHVRTNPWQRIGSRNR